MCTLCQTATRRRSAAATPISKGDGALPRTFLVPTSSSVDERVPTLSLSFGSCATGHTRVNLLPSLVTLYVKKKIRSCLPLRVCSLLVDSTARHLCTPCVRWSSRGECPGIPIRASPAGVKAQVAVAKQDSGYDVRTNAVLQSATAKCEEQLRAHGCL